MASTRNKNTTSDYCIQQNAHKHMRAYIGYENGYAGKAYENALPFESVGILPSRMSREAFSTNSVDIESALRGINSTNLVSPQAPVNPSLRELPEVKFYDRMAFYMPEPLVVNKYERPFQHANN
jgi:hypothetical protein